MRPIHDGYDSPALIREGTTMPKTAGQVGRRSRKGRPDPNHIPEHQAQAFEASLDELIAQLGETHGFKGRYLRNMYKTKYMDPRVVTPEQRRSAAIEKWLSTEVRNSSTNCRLYLGDVDFGWCHSDQLLQRTRDTVAQVLGPLRYPEVLSGGSHTTGASTRIPRGPEAAILKHTGIAHVSSSAVKHWLQCASNSVLSDQVIAIQEHSVLFTVPKATEIDRVACKEPEINMFLQRQVGNHIRRRLRRFGVDLNDQTVNQSLARQALGLGLATIDLSSASDSISRQLVLALLPFDWWNLLDDLRVHSTEIDGSIHELEMFSSMGNGFTFELESLIFWALARSVMYFSGKKGKLSVYGDDIIVPSAIAPRLARIFAWLGFKVNTKKSHWRGAFRESCGSHYYRGYDVTPFFVREPVRKKTDVIRLLNRLLEWDGRGIGFISEPLILNFHLKWSKLIPEKLRGGQDIDSPDALVTGEPPRCRLIRKTIPVEQVPEAERLICWFTVKESTGEPLSLDPRKEVRFSIAPQPSWTEHTTWDPYYIADLHGVTLRP